jgi:hypothetical protein
MQPAKAHKRWEWLEAGKPESYWTGQRKAAQARRRLPVLAAGKLCDALHPLRQAASTP